MTSTRKVTLLAIASLIVFALPLNAAMKKELYESFKWNDQVTLPCVGNTEASGRSGAFVGFAGNYMLVAGGRNECTSCSNANVNIICDNEIVPLENVLPHALAYGVGITLDNGLLCIGGCDSAQCYKDVFLLTCEDGKVHVDTSWPQLPVPLAYHAGALLNNKVYVAGGQECMAKDSATNHFLMLDLSNKQHGWVELPTWPGDARIQAVCATQGDGFDKCFFLFSGLANAQDDKMLVDAYAYNPRLNSWRQLNGEFPVQSAAAMPSGYSHIIFFGCKKGQDVPNAGTAADQTVVMQYHTITHTMACTDTLQCGLPNHPSLVKKGNAFYIEGAEVTAGEQVGKVIQGEIVPFKKEIGWLNILVIALYFALLAWMGWFFSRRQRNTDDYFKGSGRLPWWVVGLSIYGTMLSAITFMSIPAKAYATDWSYIIFNTGIVLVVPLIVMVFIPFFRKLNVTTAYEYLEQRFNGTIRIICSISFILFQIGRMGIVMFLPAIALNIVTGFDIFLCIALMGVLSLAYTMMGGIEAVVWTEALQVVVLLGGAILVAVIGINQIPGGFTAIVDEAAADGKFDLGSMAFNLKQPAFWTVLIATIFTNITTYGTDQAVVQRYMTTATEKQARKSVYTNALLNIPSTFLFFFVGTVLYVFYKHFPTQLSATISDGDAILPWYIYSQLPPGVVGLLISGIFAAAMSTISSSMNSGATAYITDIYAKFSHKSSLRAAKVATFVLGIIGIAFALTMATWDINSLWDEFNKLLGIILGSMGGLFLLGMVTKRANAFGALCGIIGSVIVQLMVAHTQAVYLLLYTTTGFIACFVIGYIVSLMVPSNKKDITHLTIYGIGKNK